MTEDDSSPPFASNAPSSPGESHDAVTRELIQAQLALEEDMCESGARAYLKRMEQLRRSHLGSRTGAARGLLCDVLDRYAAALRAEMVSALDRPGSIPEHLQVLVDSRVDPDALATAALSQLLDVTHEACVLAKLVDRVGGAINREVVYQYYSSHGAAEKTYTRRSRTPRGEIEHETVRQDLREFFEPRWHPATSLYYGALVFAPEPFKEWEAARRHKIGLFLVMLAVETLELWEECEPESQSRPDRSRTLKKRTHRPQRHFRIRKEVQEELNAEDRDIGTRHPRWDPMVVPPKKWTNLSDGGYLTVRYELLGRRRQQQSELQRLLDQGELDLAAVFGAINRIQGVAWRISGTVLRIADQLLRLTEHTSGDQDELINTLWPRMPRDPDAVEETDVRPIRNRREYAYRIVGQAHRVGERERVYFPCFLDYRGRIYCRPGPLSPQGNDLARALLQFADARPLESIDGYHWFLRHGANVLGEDRSDKLEADEQVRLMEAPAMQERVREIARDPIASVSLWSATGERWRFLAFALEYARYLETVSAHGDHADQPWLAFETALPISMDATSSGLQHFSLAMRDRPGAEVTNLLPAPRRDLYGEIASVLIRELESRRSRDEFYERWLSPGLIDRGLVKTIVMARQYGLGWQGARKALQAELQERHAEASVEKPFPFEPNEFFTAANLITKPLLETIASTVRAAPHVMKSIQRSARTIARAGVDLHWTSPSGFRVIQICRKTKSTTVKVSLFGSMVRTARMHVDTDQIDPKDHGSKAAANWIHSMDASHLMETINALPPGLVFGCVHDCWQVPAGEAPLMYSAAQQELVRMYRAGPLQALHEHFMSLRTSLVASGKRVSRLPPLPQFGDLDLSEILAARYLYA